MKEENSNCYFVQTPIIRQVNSLNTLPGLIHVEEYIFVCIHIVLTMLSSSLIYLPRDQFSKKAKT
jgi:hypothetical protein